MKTGTNSNGKQDASAGQCDWRRASGCPADLECQALVAEQARELAHRLRSPLGAIDLVCESLTMEQPDSEVAERLQVILRASAKLKQALNETISAVVPSQPAPRQPLDLAHACKQLADANDLDYERNAQAPVWIAAAPPDGELALSLALSLARLGSRDGQVRLALIETGIETGIEKRTGVELSLTPRNPRGPFDQCLASECHTQCLAFLRLKRLRRFAAEQGGTLEIEPSRLLLRLRTVAHEGDLATADLSRWGGGRSQSPNPASEALGESLRAGREKF